MQRPRRPLPLRPILAFNASFLV